MRAGATVALALSSALAGCDDQSCALCTLREPVKFVLGLGPTIGFEPLPGEPIRRAAARFCAEHRCNATIVLGALAANGAPAQACAAQRPPDGELAGVFFVPAGGEQSDARLSAAAKSLRTSLADICPSSEAQVAPFAGGDAACAAGAPSQMWRCGGDALLTWLRGVVGSGATGCEIGVWRGRSAAEVVRAVAPAVLHLVDPWRHRPDLDGVGYGRGSARGASQAAMDEIFASAIATLNAVVARVNVDLRVHRMPAADALRLRPARGSIEPPPIANGELDFIIVDGSHGYEDVLSDLSLAFAKLRPGGVLVGDDWHWSWGEAAGAPSSSRARAPVGEAVLDFLALHGPRAALIGVCHGRYVLHKDGSGAPS